jgi:hypothetical protein
LALATGLFAGVRAGYAILFGSLAVTPELTVDIDRWGMADPLASLRGLPGADVASKLPDALWLLSGLAGARVGYSAPSWGASGGLHLGVHHSFQGGTQTFGVSCDGEVVWKVSDGFALGPTLIWNMAGSGYGSMQWVVLGVAGTFGS